MDWLSLLETRSYCWHLVAMGLGSKHWVIPQSWERKADSEGKGRGKAYSLLAGPKDSEGWNPSATKAESPTGEASSTIEVVKFYLALPGRSLSHLLPPSLLIVLSVLIPCPFPLLLCVQKDQGSNTPFSSWLSTQFFSSYTKSPGLRETSRLGDSGHKGQNFLRRSGKHQCVNFVWDKKATECFLSFLMLNTKQVGRIERFSWWKNTKENGLNKSKLLSNHNKCEWIKAIILKDKHF